MYSVTCPNCGNKVDVPAGPHTVVATASQRETPAGISIDGKSVHRCDAWGDGSEAVSVLSVVGQSFDLTATSYEGGSPRSARTMFF